MSDINIIEEIRQLYRSVFSTGQEDKIRIEKLAQGGGDRQYFRIHGNNGECVATFTPDEEEGRCFTTLARDFKNAGCAVPEIYAVSRDCRCYLQEDLGDSMLFSKLNEDDADQLVRETLLRLVQLQQTPYTIWKDDCVYTPFNRRQIMWDLNYFKYEFIRPSNVIFNENALEDEFERFAERLESIPDNFRGFMMRDCQSRNVMITGKRPVFIDFQGGRQGPSLYDAVSFLWQSRAGFSDDFRASMIDYYADAYCKGDAQLKKQMLSYLPDMVLFRTLQVLGAYGFRGLVQHRSHFLLSIPGALKNLSHISERGVLDGYPQLKEICQKIIDLPRFQKTSDSCRLTVEVFSFSYKKGYPEDLSGNGGGFMFDCRAMHNPGRYKEYKTLTGRDSAVMEFLEGRGEVQPFLKNAWSMTDAAVERYISRGFTNLQIGFGCTGGQHRSVYCAVATANHIRTIFPEVSVILTHREHPSD